MFSSIANYSYTTKLFNINNNTNNNSKFCCKMSKRHEENKDIRLVSRVAKIDYSNKTILIPKDANVGIRTLGRIDYLVNHCGWWASFNASGVRPTRTTSEDYAETKREIKRQRKEPKLANKKR